MAQLAMAVAGAAIGGAVGGPAGARWGWMIGSTAGAMLFAPDGPDIQGPRITDLQAQSADYGGPIPELWGSMRLGGQVISSSDIRETKHEEEVGGKGGGGGTQTTYTYDIDIAIAFCEGPVSGIRNIWANGNLIWTADPNASADDLANSIGNVTVYYGTEDQDPDPAMESVHGAGNVPAYRGLCYIVFDNFQLEKFGNVVPSFEAEVIVEGTLDESINNITDFTNYPDAWASFVDGDGDPVSYGREFLGVDDGISSILYYPTLNWSVNKNFVNYIFQYTPSGQLIGKRKPTFREERNSLGYINSSGLRDLLVDVYGDRADIVYLGHIGKSATISGNRLWQIGGSKKMNEQSWPPRPGDSITDHRPVLRLGNKDILSGVLTEYDGYLTSVAINKKTDQIWCIFSDGTSSSATSEKFVIFDSSGNVERQGEINVGGFDTRLRLQNGSFEDDGLHIWAYEKIVDVELDMSVYKLDEGTNTLNFVKSGNVLASEPPLSISSQFPVFWATSGLCYFHFSSGFALLSRHPNIDPDTYAVSDIITSLSLSSGLTESDIDVSAIDDVTTGYSRAQIMTARGAIEPLQQVYYFDAVESDWIIKFVKRGGASVATIAEDDLAASINESTSEDAVEIIRKQELELPREISINFVDANFDYQTNTQRSSRIVTNSKNVAAIDLPLALTADQAMQITEVLLYNIWQARNTFNLKLSHKYEHLDPTDVITITENGNTHTIRIVGIKNGDVLEIEGVEERASVYSSAASGFARTGGQAITARGPTNAIPLDIPLLRETDDNAGYYLAVTGVTTGWPGCVWYMSTDEGSTYGQVRAILVSSNMGVCNTALSSDVSSTVIDTASSLNVTTSGTLSSITDAQLLDGVSNAAAVGEDGSWELIQFKNATLEEDGTYTLDTFVRGRKGTDWAISTQGQGKQFILLNTNIRHMDMNSDQIGTEYYYKAVTAGRILDTAPEITFTNTAVALKPYSPVHLQATDNGDGTFSATWIRRDRLGGEWRDGVDVPMSEATESYRVIVERSGSEISSTDVSSASATVTAISGDVLKVAQISAVVGAGYYTEITL